MAFAARLSKAFITPDEVADLERWSGRGILEALIGIHLPADVGGSYPSSVFHMVTNQRIKTITEVSQSSRKCLGIEIKRKYQDPLESINSSALMLSTEPMHRGRACMYAYRFSSDIHVTPFAYNLLSMKLSITPAGVRGYSLRTTSSFSMNVLGCTNIFRDCRRVGIVSQDEEGDKR